MVVITYYDWQRRSPAAGFARKTCTVWAKNMRCLPGSSMRRKRPAAPLPARSPPRNNIACRVDSRLETLTRRVCGLVTAVTVGVESSCCRREGRATTNWKAVAAVNRATESCRQRIACVTNTRDINFERRSPGDGCKSGSLSCVPGYPRVPRISKPVVLLAPRPIETNRAQGGAVHS